jgi:hypothetical protein
MGPNMQISQPPAGADMQITNPKLVLINHSAMST